MPIEQKHACHLVDPRKSKWLSYWDLTTSLALIFTALVTPYEVAFLPSAFSADEPLFIINRSIDGIFALDMILQFCLMFEMGSSSMTHGAVWVTKGWEIARNYLRGWFALDFCSVAVSAFDFLSLGQQGGGGLSQFKIFRVLRVLRLVKLARLLRASRIAKRCVRVVHTRAHTP